MTKDDDNNDAERFMVIGKLFFGGFENKCMLAIWPNESVFGCFEDW